MVDVAFPQPRWRVTLDGQDITGKIAPRLMSLTVASERGQDADQLDLTVSDHDGRLALPKHGVTIDVSLGWDTTGLVSMGTFTVDEVEHSGSPDKVVVRARSAHLASAIRQRRSQSWDDKLVGDIINELAGRNGLVPAISAKLKNLATGHVDQTTESDLNILTRLGRAFDSVATIKDGKLLFKPVGDGKSASGKTIPSITIVRRDGDQHRYHKADRDAYTGVKAEWHDVQDAQKKSVVAGDEKTVKTLPSTYATETDATNAATSEWKRVQRGTATFEIQLARGRADVYPEMKADVSGFKPEIDGTEWLVKRVEHSLGDNAFTTRVECETANAPPPQVETISDDVAAG